MKEHEVNQISQAIYHVLESPNECDRNLEPANVVDGLFAIARSLVGVAAAIDRLGTGSASTPMGAIEVLSKEVRDGCQALAQAVAEANTTGDR